jgi:cytochrome c-type biogenesis protein CcmH
MMIRQAVRIFVAGLLVVSATSSSWAQSDLDDRVRAVAAELRCPVCQNLSVADSPSEMAGQMRTVIRERLQAGQNPEAIIAYFTEKYGEWILLSPKTRGFNLIVWLLPGAAMLAGLMGVGWTARRWLRRTSAIPEAARDEDDSYLRRVREELKNFGESPGSSSLRSASIEQGTRPPKLTNRPAIKRRLPLAAAWGGGVLGFGVILGVLLVRSLEPRMEGMTITGGVGGGMAGMEMTLPSGGTGNLNARLATAHAFIDQQRFAEAFPIYEKILEQDPHNLEALTHLAIAQANTGRVEAALATFDRALAMDPNNLHALWNKSQALFEIKQDYAASIPLWERIVALVANSPDAATARKYLEQAKQKVGAQQGALERR